MIILNLANLEIFNDRECHTASLRQVSFMQIPNFTSQFVGDQCEQGAYETGVAYLPLT